MRSLHPIHGERSQVRARGLIGTLILLSASTPATAQDADGWSGQVTPYVWGMGVGGTIRPFTGAPALELDKSLFDLLEDLDAAFFLTGYARRNRLVLLGDVSYSSSSRNGTVPPGIPAEGKLRQTSLTVLAGYRAVNATDITVDLLGGARAWWISASVQVPAAGLQTAPGLDFVDPVLALRSNTRLGSRWSAIVYGDLGGFGAGSALTGQVLGTVNLRASSQFYLSGGYRYLAVDYQEDGTEVDVALAGPLLGITWRF